MTTRSVRTDKEYKCDVCQAEPVVGVAAVPFVPISVGYGRKCLKANAHPLWILLANTASIADTAEGWRENSNEEWQKIIDDTLVHLGRTEDEFKEMLAKEIEVYGEYLEEAGAIKDEEE